MPQSVHVIVKGEFLFQTASLLTTWWQLKAFMTEASFRNSIRSLRLADSLTVFTATCESPSPLMMSFAMPSYTMPKDPWPNSLKILIFSLGTSHSSSSYTAGTLQEHVTNFAFQNRRWAAGNQQDALFVLFQPLRHSHLKAVQLLDFSLTDQLKIKKGREIKYHHCQQRWRINWLKG